MNGMKKIVLVSMALACMTGITSAGLFDKITQNDQQVVVTNDIVDPLRDGAHNPWQWIQGLYYNGQIFSFLQAENQTIAYIQRIVNRALTFVGIIALLYLLYSGFLMVTAAWRDDQFKKWVTALRTSVIAIVWMALAGFLVNFILYLISKIL
jgi:hypothetical protein